MLRVTVAGTKYEFDQASMSNKEARAIERFSGQRISHFQNAELSVSDVDHMTVLVWLCRRRDGEMDLALDDVEFDINNVDVEDVADPTDGTAPGAKPDPTTPAPESSAAGKRTGSRTVNTNLSVA